MAAQRDSQGRFTSKPAEALSTSYQRRIERGLAQGKSLAQARGHSTTSLRVSDTPGAFNQAGYEKGLEVLSRMRRGESFNQACKEAHTSPDTALRYVGSALERQPNGRREAKPVDRLYRRMLFHTSRGEIWVEPANSKEATKLSQYAAAVKRYRDTGDVSDLKRFQRMRLRTRDKISHRFITDTETLDQLAEAGELSYESMYDYTR